MREIARKIMLIWNLGGIPQVALLLGAGAIICAIVWFCTDLKTFRTFFIILAVAAVLLGFFYGMSIEGAGQQFTFFAG